MSELDERFEAHSNKVVGAETKRELTIFKTDIDRYGRDITTMSDFFDGYVQQMTLALKKTSSMELVAEIPVADLGIINDVIHQANVVMNGNITLLPDFDNLPVGIKEKLKKGLYKVGESKQTDGNLRAVILDENDVRVKDITLKKVLNNSGNIETARSIGNQLQMRQIHAKLAEIQEFQTYQLEKDRDRDIIVPFLDARSLIIEAENKGTEAECTQLIKAADGKIRTALNAIYADIETTSKTIAKKVNFPFLSFGNKLDTYMGYLTSDFQIATKYVGVRMQLLEYLGDVKNSKSVLQQYQHVMYDFLTKPITKKELSAATLMHDYFPYDASNMNCWYTFKEEMQPALKSAIETLDLSMNGICDNEVFVVSMEDIEHEEKE